MLTMRMIVFASARRKIMGRCMCLWAAVSCGLEVPVAWCWTHLSEMLILKSKNGQGIKVLKKKIDDGVVMEMQCETAMRTAQSTNLSPHPYFLNLDLLLRPTFLMMEYIWTVSWASKGYVQNRKGNWTKLSINIDLSIRQLFPASKMWYHQDMLQDRDRKDNQLMLWGGGSCSRDHILMTPNLVVVVVEPSNKQKL